MDEEMRDALAAGVQRASTARDMDRAPYPSDARIEVLRVQVLRVLEDMDGALTISELREMLE